MTGQRPLRVVRIISGLRPGGVEKKLATILPRLDRSRFHVSVICLKQEGELAKQLRDQGITVDLIPVMKRWSPLGIRRLARALREMRVDIVHTHMYRSNVTGTVAARIAGIPVVISNVHNVSNWDDRRQMLTDRVVSKMRDCTVFVSQGVCRDYIENIPLKPAKYSVIYNGIDTEYYSPDPCRSCIKANTGLLVGCAARLMPQKGLETLVKAAADPAIQAAGVRILVAGEGPMRSDLENLARKLGTGDHFQILGFTENIRDFYRKLDVFAMPSLKEGFSNALLEAMACGVPVVVTAVGGNPEAVRDGKDGILVRPSDFNDFLLGLKKILFDDDLRKMMAREALAHAQEFSLERMIRQTEDLYLTFWNKKSQ